MHILDCRTVLELAVQQGRGYDSPSCMASALGCGRTTSTYILAGGPNPLSRTYPMHRVSQALLDSLVSVLDVQQEDLLAPLEFTLAFSSPTQELQTDVRMELKNDCVVWRDTATELELHLKMHGQTPVGYLRIFSRSAILKGNGMLQFVGWQIDDEANAVGTPIQVKIAMRY